MMQNRELAAAIREIEQIGWRGKDLASGNIRFTHPQAAEPVMAYPSSTDDRAAIDLKTNCNRALRKNTETLSEPKLGSTAIQHKPKSARPGTPRRTAGNNPLSYDVHAPLARGMSRSIGRETSPGTAMAAAVVSAVTAVATAQERLMAWAYNYLRLREDKAEMIAIHVMRRKFRLNEEYRAAAIQKFRLNRKDFERLRLEQRGRAGAEPERLPVMALRPTETMAHESATVIPMVRTPDLFVIDLKRQLEKARAAADTAVQQRHDAEIALAQERDRGAHNLFEMRQKKLQAEAARDDMERQLGEARMAKSVVDPTKTIALEREIQALRGVVNDLTAGQGRIKNRVHHIETTLAKGGHLLSGPVPILAPVVIVPPEPPEPPVPTKRTKAVAAPKVAKAVKPQFPRPIALRPRRHAERSYNIGPALREIRLGFKLSQKALGEFINIGDVMVCNWETGKKPTQDFYVDDLIECLGITKADLGITD